MVKKIRKVKGVSVAYPKKKQKRLQLIRAVNSMPKKRKSKRPRDNMMVTTIPSSLANLSTSTSSAKPHITHIPERMERVSSILGKILFSSGTFLSINPGLAATFPWLSTIAQAYELYKFTKLWFEYRTTSGEVVSGTNPAIGKVIMNTNYDPDGPILTNIQQMENYEGNCNFPPYQKIARHYVDVNGKKMGQVTPYSRRYVRSDIVSSTTNVGGSPDPHAYDLGFLQVAVAGMPADGNQVGELWVGYEIDLIKPKVADNITNANFRYASQVGFVQTAGDVLSTVGNNEVYQTTNISYSNPFITTGVTFEIDFTLAIAQYYLITLKVVLLTGGNNASSLSVGFGNATIPTAVSGLRAPSATLTSAGTTSTYYAIVTPTSTTNGTIGMAVTLPIGTAHSATGTVDVMVSPWNLPHTIASINTPGRSRVFGTTDLEKKLDLVTKQLEEMKADDEKKDDDRYSIISTRSLGPRRVLD